MNKKLLHTPEGVRDIYGKECKKKLNVMNKLHNVLELYSYQDIETPSFEYFDIFNMETNTNETFKFFDRENETLVLRPDITPSIARSVAKYYADEELPIRLCYKGQTFSNSLQHQGKLCEGTQIGGELVNDDSSAADAEIIACVIDCLLNVGLKEFKIEIGEVEYFKGLIEEANLDSETEANIKEYIQLKNFFGLSEYVEGLNISSNMKKALSSFDNLFGGEDVLEKAKALVTNEKSLTAIDRMKKVIKALSYYGFDKYVSFDLSTINNFNYYTGIVFGGYTYGTGDAIVKGGRYNNLLAKFGKNAPSVGFAIYVDELMRAINRNDVSVDIDYSDMIILYDIDNQKSAIELAGNLRAKGKKIQLIRKSQRKTIDDYIQYAKAENLQGIYYFKTDTNIELVSIPDDKITDINLNDLV